VSRETASCSLFEREVIMQPGTLRRVPWTCEWGRFGVAIEVLTPADSPVDDVFWACHHPVIAPHFKALTCGECSTCPLWHAASRLAVPTPLA
jgi:hypothetical protein